MRGVCVVVSTRFLTQGGFGMTLAVGHSFTTGHSERSEESLARECRDPQKIAHAEARTGRTPGRALGHSDTP